jgi:hypothetical protein
MKKLSLLMAAGFLAMPLLAQAEEAYIREFSEADKRAFHEQFARIREMDKVHGEYSQELNPNRKYFPKQNLKTLDQDSLDSKYSNLNEEFGSKKPQNGDSNIIETSDAEKIEIMEQARKYKDASKDGRALPDTQTKEEIQSEGDEAP